jgi:hypothetical protein
MLMRFYADLVVDESGQACFASIAGVEETYSLWAKKSRSFLVGTMNMAATYSLRRGGCSTIGHKAARQ